MCGIVGAIAQRNVTEILLEGLRRLEYRGYDSAGMAILDNSIIEIRKETGKVINLETAISNKPTKGQLGIAHTRWATHGRPTQKNAHPHSSDKITLVHNGIIENYTELREQLIAKGYRFISETDTEVVAHLINDFFKQLNDLLQAVKQSVALCEGAYALGVICEDVPDTLVVARKGSPLVIGLGIEENFIASDQLALRQVTDQFIYLEEGDLAEVTAGNISIYDSENNHVERKKVKLTSSEQSTSRGQYRHYMLKEIYEQPAATRQALQGRLGKTQVLEACFGSAASEIFDQVAHVQIIACGTSYHSGMVAKYWMESLGNLQCSVEIASEFRYRKAFIPANTLVVTISQSGETADTLAALQKAKQQGILASLAICNVPNSALVRESTLSIMTAAGPEIGVASTKAFTTQLVVLQLLTIVLGRRHGLSEKQEAAMVKELRHLPSLCEDVLKLDKDIEKISEAFIEKNHALFLGRGMQYPIALEGALKLKEISYIHAEAYPAGELKHGPLALVDSEMPIIAVAPNDDLLDKLKSNLEEVQARGGQLFVFADTETNFKNTAECIVIHLPKVPYGLCPIVFTLPLQLLSYHVAVLKGTDVDQPRNLAKSVTVE
ncbi:glutamine--fructose-6-phosphate aminotransferase [Candidatus Endobugula sertula]|uniref:Glutamine--fructose-6-phosphate aminotransferase [isomerizing] n=1 Tax=Candidatus Endobugula sertula TaxID=62101 RepID=A0A1D2QNL9_9GAMM|nr:glutamine--fructose-6-phosphate aminotransferase [Candidatus Endobugula sertula]